MASDPWDFSNTTPVKDVRMGTIVALHTAATSPQDDDAVFAYGMPLPVRPKKRQKKQQQEGAATLPDRQWAIVVHSSADTDNDLMTHHDYDGFIDIMDDRDHRLLHILSEVELARRGFYCTFIPEDDINLHDEDSNSIAAEETVSDHVYLIQIHDLKFKNIIVPAMRTQRSMVFYDKKHQNFVSLPLDISNITVLDTLQ